MFKPIRRFFTGWRRVRVSNESSAKVFDSLYRKGISFDGEKRLSDGIEFNISEREYKEVCECLECCAVSEVHGLPYVAGFVIARPMVAVGMLMFYLWMSYSSQLIWDVRVEGNTKTDSSEITEMLADLGCGIGDRYTKINFNKLHADYAAMQHDIAWLSVFMNGSVAEVQVRELYRNERKKHENGTYANIVADCDGVVEEVNVIEGQAAVFPGQLVRKGQVLISGVVEGKDGEFRYEYAEGEVICRTATSICEKVNVNREKKAYTGREKTRFRVKIFKKMINLFIKGGIEYDVCDTISTMDKLCPLGLCEIPVWIEKTVSREYVSENEQISAERASEEAMLSLNRKIKRLTTDAELEYKEIHSKFEDGVYTIECMLYLRRNTAATSEFTVQNQ